MEYVQFSQKAKPEVKGRIFEKDVDLYEENGDSKLSIFL
jgi:hypothetical protein